MRYILLLIATFISNICFAQKGLTFSDSLYFYKLSVDSSIVDDDYECNVKTINVLHQPDLKTQQTIKLEKNPFPCYWIEDEFFVIEDMNFDGYNDIRLMQSMGARGNTSYLFWLYNRDKKTFVRDSSLENLSNPQFDPKEKKAYSYWSVGCCEYGSNIYQVVNGKLALVEDETMHLNMENEKEYILTIRKLVDGEMKIIEEKHLSREEVEGEEEENEE
jgi:hypothetical protein